MNEKYRMHLSNPIVKQKKVYYTRANKKKSKKRGGGYRDTRQRGEQGCSKDASYET